MENGGDTALIAACRAGHEDVVEYLLANQATVNHPYHVSLSYGTHTPRKRF
jgi:ankyrin repeat protein